MAFGGDRDSVVAIERERPDAVLTDVRMPPNGTDEGIEIARELRITQPEIGVVFLSQFVEPRRVLAFFDGGTARRAYLLAERVSGPRQLAAAIQAVVEGASVIDPEVVEPDGHGPASRPMIASPGRGRFPVSSRDPARHKRSEGALRL